MADKKQDNLIGRQLGDYKLTEAFAAGGMAQIYRGVDVKLGRPAAVKVLPQEILETDEMLTERFKREAQAVANLEHERIVPIYQYGEEEDVLFLAMKFIVGEDLADELNRLQRKGQLMDVRRMFKILDQIAGALDFAHAHGVVHRDVKPSNIMIDKADRAFLTDFGLVLRHQVDKTMGTAFGTPRYISPEQALASERAVPQSDIYSLAVIVYEILTGDMVFKADTAMQIALSHISEPPPPPSSINPAIPKAVEREILKALDKVPEKRHISATAFMKALRDAYGDNLPNKTQSRAEVLATKTPPMKPDSFQSELKQKINETAALLDDNPTVPYAAPTAEFASPQAAKAAVRQAAAVPSIPRPDSPALADDPPTDPIAPPMPDARPGKRQKKADSRREQQGQKAGKKRASLSRRLLRLLLILIIGLGAGIAAFVYLGDDNPLEDVVNDATARAASGGDNTTTENIADPTTAAQEVIDRNASSDTATAPPTNPPTEIVFAGDGESAVLHYNEEAFVLLNTSEFTLDVDSLEFARADDTDSFSGRRIVRRVVPPGTCVLILLQGRQVEIPDAWACDPIHSQIQLPADSFFWRIEDDSVTTFEIRAGSTVIATCPALLRGADDTCEIQWPFIASN